MELITGYKGQAHVTAAQTGATNAGVMGTGKYILAVGGEMAAAIVDNNHVSIANGYGINQGRYFFTNGETLTIATGTTGTKREDLIVARYEKVASGVESASLKVIKGTSGNAYVTPSYTSGNILGGDYVDEMPLFKVHLNGAEIVDIVRVSEVKEKADKSTTLEGYGITNAVSNNNLAAYSGGTTWEGGHSYAINDIVLYINVAYICKVAHSSSTTNTPGTAGGATYWNVISLGTLNTSLTNFGSQQILLKDSLSQGESFSVDITEYNYIRVYFITNKDPFDFVTPAKVDRATQWISETMGSTYVISVKISYSNGVFRYYESTGTSGASITKCSVYGIK